MLPLRDINPTRRAPVATYVIIALNLAVFVYQHIVLTPSLAEVMVGRHSVIPYFLLSGYGPSLSTPLTSMFIHGSLFHLLSNMWFLHVFGDNVEDALGRPRFVVFYLFTGLVAVLLHVAMHSDSRLPLVGASGAVSGVMGAYALLYPRARVLTMVPVLIFPFFFELPALLIILVWFAVQLIESYVSLSAPETTGVAFFAHIGGFLAGVAFVLARGRQRTAPVGYLGPRIPTRALRRRG